MFLELYFTCILARQLHAMPSRIYNLRQLSSHSFFLRPIPVEALRVPGRRGSLTSTQSAHESGKVVRPTYRRTLPHQEIFPVLVFLSSWIDRRVIGLCEWKIPMTTSGIETANFQLLAQCLNQLQPCLLPYNVISVIKTRIRKLILLRRMEIKDLTNKFSVKSEAKLTVEIVRN